MNSAKTPFALLFSLLFALSLPLFGGCASPATGAEAKSGATAKEKEEASKAAPTQTGSRVEAIVARGTLRVATTGEQPPFSMKSESGELLGFEIDLARALARALGVEAEFIELPFGEVLPAVESGKADLALSSLTMTPKRNLKVAFVGPYFISGKALLTKSTTLAKSNETQSLDDVRVKLAALKGSTSEELISKTAPRAELKTFEKYEDAVTAVKDGSVNALVADFPQVAITIMRNPDEEFVGLGDPLSFEPIGAAVASDDAHLHNIVGNYIGVLEGMGLLQVLRKRWFENGDWLKALPGVKGGDIRSTAPVMGTDV